MKNKYEINGDIVTIYIERRDGSTYECLVDIEDLGMLQTYGSWYIGVDKNTFYARARSGSITIHMHRQIMKAPEGYVVDHVDGNGLNNTKKNLRIVTHKNNMLNRQTKSEGTGSTYLNTYWHKASNKWVAKVNNTHLGYYPTEWVAALVSLEYKMSLGCNNLDHTSELLSLKSKHLEIYEKEVQEGKHRQKHGANTSGIKGVSWVARDCKWRASIYVNGKTKHIGQYTDKYEAGRAVSKATLQYLGSKQVHRVPISLSGLQ
ncbi:MAG: HNH endonuclease [Cetobacterium sp.]